jgi:2-C-methyl-D-erythritol 2,4-cyclodiphosphate synthase
MTRVGLGFDAHAFDPARALVLGGVAVSGSPGLAGHSDADVVSHAVADALLGAARLGDLGEHFPSDGRWRDASSLDILRAVADLIAGAGYEIVNVDATVIAENPKVAPYRTRMVDALSGALGLEADDVSVKASTTDSLGFAGRAEGMASVAVALLERAGSAVGTETPGTREAGV